MKLTDTQLVVLSAASLRPRNLVLPLPERLRGGAAAKVVRGLLSRGLAAEVPAARDEPVWRAAEDGRRLTLVATGAALAALGIAPDGAPERANGAAREDPAAAAAATGQRRPPRAGTKQARLIGRLEAEDGATIAEIAAATGWQPHTVRGVGIHPSSISWRTDPQHIRLPSQRNKARIRALSSCRRQSRRRLP